MPTKPVLAAPVPRSLPGGARSSAGAEQGWHWFLGLPAEAAGQSLWFYPIPTEGADQDFYPYPFPAEGADQSWNWWVGVPAEGVDA